MALIDLTLPLEQDNPFSREKPNLAGLGHLGTHLDVIKIPPPEVESFISPGRLVDVNGIWGRPLEPGDLDGLDAAAPGEFLILNTGWLAAKYPEPEYFGEHPELSDAALEALLAARPGFIGIDAPGLGRGKRHQQLDSRAASERVFIVENLVNTHRLGPEPFTVYCFPLHLADSTGLPVRVLAEL